MPGNEALQSPGAQRQWFGRRWSWNRRNNFRVETLGGEPFSRTFCLRWSTPVRTRVLSPKLPIAGPSSTAVEHRTERPDHHHRGDQHPRRFGPGRDRGRRGNGCCQSSTPPMPGVVGWTRRRASRRRDPRPELSWDHRQFSGCPSSFAGTPATVAPSGTSRVTTAPAPTKALRPIEIPGRTFAPVPIVTPSAR